MYWLLISNWPMSLKKLVKGNFNYIQAVPNKTIVKSDAGELLLVQLFFQLLIFSATPAFFGCWESLTMLTTAPNGIIKQYFMICFFRFRQYPINDIYQTNCHFKSFLHALDTAFCCSNILLSYCNSMNK